MQAKKKRLTLDMDPAGHIEGRTKSVAIRSDERNASSGGPRSIDNKRRGEIDRWNARIADPVL